ncbi:tRNA lysidine(34) synthetase TilS [Litorihabitans aurantiacus]|uniref:tRNA(Ile)-lysidine synthase n=1 Tax=Litorihabitans aurantiacus TaxID=1930061 RepID=A0AA37XGN4_9MICO|nr:tRNA lysidine(34) synthetase TilS [Litorihabitans aurantiacus]GMA32452.1 tRNA(Ile)-lysidine synthase [Litorihabitans aurantiacus]
MTGPDPAVARARLAVREHLAPLASDGAAPLVLVACSGGADSLALAAATAFVAPRLGLRAGAVVVDHALATGSDAVAERAARACRDLGLDPVCVERVAVPRRGGLEGRAREVRHVAFDDVAARTGAVAVLLGHTADDQAETVLLRLARGSGARSLAGMPERRDVLGRPLLGLRRADLRAACLAQDLTWWEDPGNAVDGPQTTAAGQALPRSAVRHRALPALGAALGVDPVPALVRTAGQLARDADLLDRLAADLLAEARTPSGPAVATLASAHAALLPRALRAWLLAEGVPAGDLGAVHLDAVAALVTAWRGQRGVDVPGGRRVVRVDGVLTLAPRTSRQRPPGRGGDGGCGTLDP